MGCLTTQRHLCFPSSSQEASSSASDPQLSGSYLLGHLVFTPEPQGTCCFLPCFSFCCLIIKRWLSCGTPSSFHWHVEGCSRLCCLCGREVGVGGRHASNSLLPDWWSLVAKSGGLPARLVCSSLFLWGDSRLHKDDNKLFKIRQYV